MITTKTEPLWKFLRLLDGKIVSQHGDATWTIGKSKYAQGVIIACENGFHASPGILAALGYVKGEVLAQVTVSGDSDVQSDKSAHRSMTIVRAWRWTQRDSIMLAVYAAELVLDVFEQKHPGDERPRKAIEAAKAWLANPSADAARAAADAADAAARAAADVADELKARIEAWLQAHLAELEEIHS